MQSKKLFLTSILLFVLVSCPLIGSVGASSEMWSQTYGGAEGDYAHSLVETSDGGFAIAGITRDDYGFDIDCLLVKTDEYGNMEWNQTYGEGSASSLVETSDGGFALAGYSGSLDIAGKTDFWLVKTDAYGIPEFPSWIILPLLLVATLTAIICKQRLLRKSANN